MQFNHLDELEWQMCSHFMYWLMNWIFDLSFNILSWTWFVSIVSCLKYWYQAIIVEVNSFSNIHIIALIYRYHAWHDWIVVFCIDLILFCSIPIQYVCVNVSIRNWIYELLTISYHFDRDWKMCFTWGQMDSINMYWFVHLKWICSFVYCSSMSILHICGTLHFLCCTFTFLLSVWLFVQIDG